MSDNSFRFVFENSLDAMVIADDQGRYLEVNQPACELFGYPREQMLRMSVGDLVTAQAPGAQEQYREYLRAGRQIGEFTFIRADKQVRTASYSACRIAPNRHLSVLRDITAQKQAEEALRESETRFRLLVEQSPLSIQILSPDGRTLQVNRAWEELWGLTLEHLRDYNMLEDAQLVEKGIMPYIQRAFAGEATAIPPILYDPEETIPNRSKHHNTGRWTQAIMYPVKDSQGRLREVVLIHEDITEKRLAEDALRRSEERLKRSIQETHHRVKNNLQMISAMVELQAQADAETVPAAAMHRIGQHARSLAAIHDLLTQQVKADPHADSISTRAAMQRLIPLLQATLGKRRIRHRIADFPLPVQAGASLTLLTAELVSNAAKHGRGDIEIDLSVLDGSARLEVSDDGPGFPPNFDWESAANTGLGLIDMAGRYELRGTVKYGNRADGGAQVTVTFPLRTAH